MWGRGRDRAGSIGFEPDRPDGGPDKVLRDERTPVFIRFGWSLRQPMFPALAYRDLRLLGWLTGAGLSRIVAAVPSPTSSHLLSPRLSSHGVRRKPRASPVESSSKPAI